MKANYEPFIRRVINNYEGGYGWDRSDPGGPTKYGITCYDLAEHRGKVMTSMTVWAPLVQSMTLQEAEDIYVTKYANGLYFDDLRSGPDCCILDYGINSGVARPLRVARRLLNFTDPVNTTLVAAINAAHTADPKWFVDAVCQERLTFMHQIRGGSAWAEFGNGWGKRVADVKAYCDTLASGAAAPVPPDAPTTAHPKVNHDKPGTAGTTLGKSTAGGAASAGAAHAAGAPHWVLPVLFGAAIVGGLAYVFYQRQKQAAANMVVLIPPTVPPIPAAVTAAVAAISGVQNVPDVPKAS